MNILEEQIEETLSWYIEAIQSPRMTYNDLKLRRLPISGGMIPTRLKLLKFLLNQMMILSKGRTLGFA